TTGSVLDALGEEPPPVEHAARLRAAAAATDNATTRGTFFMVILRVLWERVLCVEPRHAPRSSENRSVTKRQAAS
ncbi:hypothetical protein, partial [Mesorhizobium japonicum]|uniref:hypothetical protein n=1 Tax=Mesorhizobium japonicum TaxID=2066070 RepID=UPI003B59CEC9